MPGKKVLIAAALLLIAVICGYWHSYSTNNIRYANIIDLKNEYSTDKELIAVQNKSAEGTKYIQVDLLDKYQAKVALFVDNLLFTKAFAADKYETLRQNNAGKKASATKMILTTEQAVPFAFAGLTKPAVVYDILARLKKMDAAGTFFVMKNDIDKNPQLIRDIINSGNEVQIGVRSLKGADFYSICKEIDYVRSKLMAMGAPQPTLAMQPWGAVTDDTAEAISAMGLTFMGYYVDAVNSKMKDYTSEQQVLKELIGKNVYALGRGWIVYFRLDFYTDDTLVGREMDLLKRDKIDNIAYNSFYDDPKVNLNNDSEYKVKSIGAVLNNSADRYTFATKQEIPKELRSDKSSSINKGLSFKDYIRRRYIGNSSVGKGSDVYGFSLAEQRILDMKGCIHTDKPVVFFTFDDWGTDASINRLLYVLRKHNAKATFFVLTTNVMNNPNLLRSMAKEGHAIGDHSNMHKPMSVRSPRTYAQMPSAQSRGEYTQELSDSYKKLETVVGNVAVDGHPALTRYFRPPQLVISKMGLQSLQADGYTYIVGGYYSAHDYEEPDLASMVNDIETGIFDETGAVRKGSVLVMHMSDTAEYTAVALDMILTANEQRKDGDPAKFTTARLSDYLKDGYDQSNAGLFSK